MHGTAQTYSGMSIEGLSDVYNGVAEAVENMVSAEAVKGPMQAMDMRPALVIVVIVAVSSLVLELLCWMFVYRTQDYRRIVRDIEEHHRQFAKLKHAGGSWQRWLSAWVHAISAHFPDADCIIMPCGFKYNSNERQRFATQAQEAR